MVQKIHPQGVILVPNLSLMWADQLKKLTAVPSMYKEVHAPTSAQKLIFIYNSIQMDMILVKSSIIL